jgi:site-specific recombinase XerD
MSEQDLLAHFEEYLVGMGMAPATIANYMADLRCFSEWLSGFVPGGASLLAVGVDHVRRYCQRLRLQGRSVSTINRRLQALRKFFDFVVQAGLSPHNPARDVERFDERSAAPPRVLTADEVRALLHAVGDGADSLTRRDRAILLLLLETGLKVGELVELRVEDVVLEAGQGYVLVGQDLGSGGRCLAIGAEACAALRACLRVRVSAPGVEELFVSRQGRPLSVRSVQRLVSGYAQLAGLEGVSAYALRYTFAHDTYEETQDLPGMARLLGLRDVADISRYTD